MFDLKRPCANCPFRRGQGSLYRLPAARLKEIFNATAFQCHKSVEHGEDEYGNSTQEAGEKPQQCAGLMALLHREKAYNSIMRVAIHTEHLDCSKLDPKREAYESFADAKSAHAGTEPPPPRPEAPYCEKCQQHAVLTSGDKIYHSPRFKSVLVWLCRGCSDRVGCHPGSSRPLGSLAGDKLRKARQRAHEAVDPIWQYGGKSRNEVYRWLGSQMNLKPKQCHIALFTQEQCEQAISICREHPYTKGRKHP